MPYVLCMWKKERNIHHALATGMCFYRRKLNLCVPVADRVDIFFLFFFRHLLLFPSSFYGWLIGTFSFWFDCVGSHSREKGENENEFGREDESEPIERISCDEKCISSFHFSTKPKPTTQQQLTTETHSLTQSKCFIQQKNLFGCERDTAPRPARARDGEFGWNVERIRK